MQPGPFLGHHDQTACLPSTTPETMAVFHPHHTPGMSSHTPAKTSRRIGSSSPFGAEPGRDSVERAGNTMGCQARSGLESLVGCVGVQVPYSLRIRTRNKTRVGFGAPKPCELEGSTPSKEGPRILTAVNIIRLGRVEVSIAIAGYQLAPETCQVSTRSTVKCPKASSSETCWFRCWGVANRSSYPTKGPPLDTP